MSNFAFTEFFLLNLISSIFILATAAASFYLLYEAKTPESRFSSLMFSIFTVTHGLYHILADVGLGEFGHLSSMVSALALMGLGVYFAAHRSSVAVAAFVPIVFLNAASDVTIAGLLIALVLFTYSAFKTAGRRIRTFKFQMSMFLIVWIISELPRAFGPIVAPYSFVYDSYGYSYGLGSEYVTFGLTMHVLAMAALWVLVYYRLGKYVWGRST